MATDTIGKLRQIEELLMATNTMESENRQLKHLGFIKIAAINTLICITNLYEYAKQNSGPLKTGFRTVESTVTTVATPVCEKFKDVPYNLLVCLDRKVDEASIRFDKDAPPFAKQVVSQASCIVQKASKLAQTLVRPFQKAAGMVIPTAAHCSEYNHIIMGMRQKGYTAFGYLPLVPLEKIAMTFNQMGVAGKEGAESK